MKFYDVSMEPLLFRNGNLFILADGYGKDKYYIGFQWSHFFSEMEIAANFGLCPLSIFSRFSSIDHFGLE